MPVVDFLVCRAFFVGGLETSSEGLAAALARVNLVLAATLFSSFSLLIRCLVRGCAWVNRVLAQRGPALGSGGVWTYDRHCDRIEQLVLVVGG